MDTANVVVNIKVPAVQFVPNPADGTKNYSIDASAGQGFTLAIPYQYGVGPFSVKFEDGFGAPAWIVADVDTPGYVTLNGTVPADQPEGPISFKVDIVDSRGTSSSVTAAVN